jgi:hypothetical protein
VRVLLSTVARDIRTRPDLRKGGRRRQARRGGAKPLVRRESALASYAARHLKARLREHGLEAMAPCRAGEYDDGRAGALRSCGGTSTKLGQAQAFIVDLFTALLALAAMVLLFGGRANLVWPAVGGGAVGLISRFLTG